MHGPEHHFLVPAVLLAAYHNVLGSPREKKAEALKLAKARGMVIPGGWCGICGCCGGAVGTGVFFAIIQGSIQHMWHFSKKRIGSFFVQWIGLQQMQTQS